MLRSFPLLLNLVACDSQDELDTLDPSVSDCIAYEDTTHGAVDVICGNQPVVSVDLDRSLTSGAVQAVAIRSGEATPAIDMTDFDEAVLERPAELLYATDDCPSDTAQPCTVEQGFVVKLHKGNDLYVKRRHERGSEESTHEALVTGFIGVDECYGYDTSFQHQLDTEGSRILMVTMHNYPFHALQVAFADLDGDGDLDLIQQMDSSEYAGMSWYHFTDLDGVVQEPSVMSAIQEVKKHAVLDVPASGWILARD